MQYFLDKLPIPVCGLILAIASLGTLAKSYQLPLVGDALSIFALGFLSLVIAKLIFRPQNSKAALKQPTIAAVAPNFSMAMMVLAVFLNQIKMLSMVATTIWYLGVIIQFLLLIYFTGRFVLTKKLKLTDILPSWFIVYVGIGVVPLTAAHFNRQLGIDVLNLALILYLFLLPIVILRLLKYPRVQHSSQPLLTVIAAPGSLCLAGYLNSYTHYHMVIIAGLLVLSQILYLVALYYMKRAI